MPPSSDDSGLSARIGTSVAYWPRNVESPNAIESATARRDQQVIELIAAGHTLRAIAGKLALSPTHVARLVKSLGLVVRKVKAKRSGSIGFSSARVGHAEKRHFPDGPGPRTAGKP